MSENTSSVAEIMGRKVISVAGGEDVGEIKAVVVDRGANRIERFQVGGRKRSPEMIDWEQVQSIGSDAVMITAAEDVHESRKDEPDDLYVRGDIEIIGATVLDTAGFERGSVTDLHFDADSGAVLAAMTNDGRVAAEQLRSLGTYALVIDA